MNKRKEKKKRKDRRTQKLGVKVEDNARRPDAILSLMKEAIPDIAKSYMCHCYPGQFPIRHLA